MGDLPQPTYDFDSMTLGGLRGSLEQWALPRLRASHRPHILCATLLAPLCGRNSETAPVRVCTSQRPAAPHHSQHAFLKDGWPRD
jgi:hypothetical protein